MTDLQTATTLLKESPLTFAAVRGEARLLSGQKGIARLVGWLKDDPRALAGFCVADAVIGKAAAMLMACGGVCEVYTPLISEPAAEVFRRHGIPFSADKTVPNIRNRDGTGICPMEKKVLDINDLDGALRVLGVN